jgi:phage virion morphogenesis protein
MIRFALEIDPVFLGGETPQFRGLDGDLNELFKKEMDQSAAAILNRLRTTFLAEQDPTGAAWIPSRSGNARRKKGGTGTLFDSGRLFNSIQLSRQSDASERAIGTDVPYARKHQFGTDGMVKREFIAITPEHEELVTSIFMYKVQELCNV